MRRLALSLAATLLLVAPAQAAAPECARTLRGIDLQHVTIPELQAAMTTGRVTSAELTEAYLARISAYDMSGPKLNSVRRLHAQAITQAQRLDAERTAGRVRSPLHGIPFLLKDNVATDDLPTTAGSIALDGVTPKRDATITPRLRDAGAVVLGKANLSEFAGWVDLDMPPGYSSLAGQVLNAYDRGATPSGSSSGSGVAASMALAGATIGTETSGSILSPSEANGIVGVKTTLGLVSRAGILPLAPSFDVPGPMVRSVTDAATVLNALAGPDPRDPATAGARPVDYTAGLRRDALKGRRLAYSEDAYESLNPEEQALFDAAVERIERLGGTVVSVKALAAQWVGATELAAIPNEFKASLNRFLAEEMPTARFRTLGEIVAYNETKPDRMKYGQDLLKASNASPGREELFPLQAALAEGDADAILTPGNAHANAGAAAGYPTVMVPLGYTTRGTRPQGLGFMGKAFTEAELLALAYAFEQSAKVRVAPTEVDASLVPGTCPRLTPRREDLLYEHGGDAASTATPRATPARRLRALRVSLRRQGRILRVTVRGVAGAKVRFVLRRGKRTAARRTVRARNGVARTFFRARRRGAYRVTVLDLGPPARTARSKRLVVRERP
jgi:amidase